MLIRSETSERLFLLVEIVMETEAEAGASGYSVTGGGHRGIFVRDVLKDSPAAKHLSLQQGDQLLSAKVYFDNVKYEDALKILQCAEPYKVSFQLKRTVTREAPSVRARLPIVEVKGPRAKAAKLITLSLPEARGHAGDKSRAEMSKPKVALGSNIHGELSAGTENIDVGKGAKLRMPKLKLPKIRLSRNSDDMEADVDIKGDVRISPPPQVKVAAGGSGTASVSVSIPEGRPGVEVSAPQGTGEGNGESGAKLEADLEGKSGFHGPDVHIKLPKFSVSGTSTVTSPDTEVLLPKPEADISEGDIKLSEGSLRIPKLPTIDVSIPKFDLDISLPKSQGNAKGEKSSDVDIDGPNLKMQDVDISLLKAKGVGPEIEIDDVGVGLPKGKMKGPNVEIEDPGGKFKMPGIKMPKVDITLPKGKIEGPEITTERPEADLEGSAGGKFKMPNIKMPNVDISLPKGTFKGPEIDIEGSKSGKINMPDVDISLPKGNIEGPELDIGGKGGGFKIPHPNLPSVDISLPKGKLEGPDVDIDVSKGGKFKIPDLKMPSVDITLPKGKAKGPEVNIETPGVHVEAHKKGKFEMPHIKMPDIDISLPKGKVEVPEIDTEGAKFKMPDIKMPNIDISLPKGKGKGLEADIEATLPSTDISLPKGKIEGSEVEIERPKGKKFKMPHLKMPDVDISLPKAKGVGPEVEIEGGVPSVDISLPKGKIGGPDVDIEGPAGGKFKLPGIKMPKIDITPPKGKIEGPEITTERPEADLEVSAGGKFKVPNIKMPNVDISLSKGKFKSPETDIERSKSGKISMPDGPELEIGGKGESFKIPHPNLPSVDISLPKGNLDGPDIDVDLSKEGKLKMPDLKMPSVDITLPKVTAKEGQKKGKFEMPHINMPDIDISLPKGKVEGPEIHTDGAKFKMPEIKMPNINTEQAGAHLEGSTSGRLPDMKFPPSLGVSQSPPKSETDFGLGGKVKLSIDSPEKGQNTCEVDKTKAKVKGTKFNIGMPKMKVHKDKVGADRKEPAISMHSSNLEGKDVISISAPGIPLQVGTRSKGAISGKVQAPRIPDIDFDIGMSPEDEDIQMFKDTTVKIPTSGVPLPSLSTPEGRLEFYGQEIEYLGPKVPKVKRAVFVLVNPDESVSPSSKPLQTANAEPGSMEMQPTFRKSYQQFSAEMEQLKGKGMEMTHGLLSTAKTESFHVTTIEESIHATHRAEKHFIKNEKGAISTEIKLPKVEITSPSRQISPKQEASDIGGKLGAQSSLMSKEASGADFESMPGTLHLSKELLSSGVRRERREGSASPSHFTTESSARVLTWSEVDSKRTELHSEDKDSSPWFRVPKFSLKPHSTGKQRHFRT
uniref:PDZ domain-containing protein n=1 Tax=Periophthalmus magnuspinnatus TaxID=409849 RepID=A0A3B3ZEU7_9GOBI